jgi:uncharacterized repeat protein (TIGR03803 family)
MYQMTLAWIRIRLRFALPSIGIDAFCGATSCMLPQLYLTGWIACIKLPVRGSTQAARYRFEKGRRMKVRIFLPLAQIVSLVAFAFIPLQGHAQTFKIVHDFSGEADGANPLNGLMLSSTGILYGTATSGGAYANGAVFSLASGKLALIHSFEAGEDGAQPQSFLIQDKTGTLYGTTYAGGGYGDGTVYRIINKTETVLYRFGSHLHDGSEPEAGLAMDSAGNLYSTTTKGGVSGHGTVFMLLRGTNGAYTEKILHNFGADPDGSTPVSGVTLDSYGNLYGTTAEGGKYGYGTVFELNKASSWAETILHSFENLSDGATPYAGLIVGPAGSLLGAATDGGENGGGTVFQLAPSSGKWTFSVLTSIPGWGVSGSFRNLMFDSANNTIYATTHCDGVHTAGTVYKLALVNGKWEYTLLYTFEGGNDGRFVFSNLVLSGGELYGTTNVGGTRNLGVIFSVTP